MKTIQGGYIHNKNTPSMLDTGGYTIKMHKLKRQTNGGTECCETSVADFAVKMAWFVKACTFQQDKGDLFNI